MRLSALALAAILAAAPAWAQPGPASPNPGGTASPAEVQEPAPAGDASTADPSLPVSLDRIREGLARPADRGLKNIDLRPDFVVRIEERDHIIKILSQLQVAPSAPAPIGGAYGYEQQRMAFPKSQYPLMQPFAAFSGGELITLAVEGLAQRYLKDKVGGVISNVMRDRAERVAREEVATAIAEYCDGQPNGGRELHLCSDVLTR